MPESYETALASADDRIEAINERINGVDGPNAQHTLTLIVLALSDLSRALHLVGAFAVDRSRVHP